MYARVESGKMGGVQGAWCVATGTALATLVEPRRPRRSATGQATTEMVLLIGLITVTLFAACFVLSEFVEIVRMEVLFTLDDWLGKDPALPWFFDQRFDPRFAHNGSLPMEPRMVGIEP